MAISKAQKLINRCKKAERNFRTAKKQTLKLVKELSEAHRALAKFSLEVGK